jgi:putative beta-1,4-xylosyltransferase IRX9
MSQNKKKVEVEGPICKSSKVVGWYKKDSGDGTAAAASFVPEREQSKRPAASRINISGFGFNSSILWDPERWGRPTSQPDTSQVGFNNHPLSKSKFSSRKLFLLCP